MKDSMETQPLVRKLARELSTAEQAGVAGGGDTVGTTIPSNTASPSVEVVEEGGPGGNTLNGQPAGYTEVYG